MTTLLILSKIFFYLIALFLVFILNFSYAFFCRHFKQKTLDTLETNLNRAGYSLFSRFEFSLDYRDLKHEERWLSYFIVTVPTLAVFIRCVYFDYAHESIGIYVLIWQLLIHAGAFILAQFRYKQFAKIIEKLNGKLDGLAHQECSSDQVVQVLSTLLTTEELNTHHHDLLKIFNQKYAKLTVFF